MRNLRWDRGEVNKKILNVILNIVNVLLKWKHIVN